jgi:hypothetical protein
LLDYRFKDTDVSNPDGTFPVQLTGVTKVPGAIESQLGQLQGALDLGTAGKGVVKLQGLQADLTQFAVRIVAQANGPVQARQNLVESSLLPFSLFLGPGAQAGEIVAFGSVRPSAHGWHFASTRFGQPLSTGRWYTIDLVHDVDTVAVFVDGDIVSVQSFPDGRMALMNGTDLFIGTWVDGARDHFNGKIAALQVTAGIPEALERQLDDRRIHPEWFMSNKRVAVANSVNLGQPTAAIAFDAAAGAYVQPHERGAVMYHDSLGAAFEIHGEIHRVYASSNASVKTALGYLTSDEGPASSRLGGRKNTFSKGAIYFSPATGPVPVTDRIFLSYEHIDGVEIIGFPAQPARAVPGGLEQRFQNGRMYHAAGTNVAYEVHGAILEKYLALGSAQRFGFPVTDEQDVRKGAQVIGKKSGFQNCDIYWSAATGAFEVHGDIRRYYDAKGGPAGELGFPTSDELDTPGAPGGRFNTLQRGALCWFGSFSSIQHVRPFRVFIGRLETDESEGFGMGQNDLYFKQIKLEQPGRTLFSARHPSSGDFDGNNNVNVNLTLPPVITPDSPNDAVTLSVDIWEADPGDDDHMGAYSKVLGPANAWGLRDNGGVYNTGRFGKVKTLTWSVKPDVNAALLSDTERFWGATNTGTDLVPYNRYAAAFRDVDSEPEWWDVSDWLEKAFYELVVDTLAKAGNCFGMSLEAIYANKGASVFALPLNRFTGAQWGVLEPEINIKHCYQVGADAIWWFVGQFVTGNTHDPKDVFVRSRDAHAAGRNPVLCIAQNYDFSGAPHCILPIGWDSSGNPWKIRISDPNFPNQTRELQVFPNENRFVYQAGNNYSGDAWSGGRLHYMPFDVLCRRPRTPIWDAILLILAGAVIILGAEAETTSITDLSGNDLDAYGDRAKQLLQSSRRADGYFVGYKGFDGRGTVAGDLLLQLAPSSGLAVQPTVTSDPGRVAQLRINDLLEERAFRPLAVELAARPELRARLGERSISRVLADPQALEGLSEAARNVLRAAAAVAKQADYVHTIRGTAAGSLRYTVRRGLSGLQMQGPIAQGEANKVTMRDIATSKWAVGLTTGRDKQMNILLDNKLGTGRDRLRLRINKLPVTAARGAEMNLRPGLGGIDLMTAGGRVDLPVSVDGRINGQPFERRFVLPAEGGVRLHLSSLVTEGRLRVGRIEQLFGPSRGGAILRPA